MSKITVKELQALTAKDHGRWITFGNSIYGKVRAGANDQVSVYVEWRYKSSGKTRTYSIGTWQDKGELSLKAIRDMRDSLSTELKSGTDPLERKATEKLRHKANLVEDYTQELERLEKAAELRARLTVRGLFELWQSIELKKRADSGSEALRAFERDVFPLIGEIPAESVTKSHIQQIVDNMMSRDVLRMTKRVLGDLRQMFSFAEDRDIVSTNPTARIKKSALGRDTERDRILSEKEVISLFQKLPQSGLTEAAQLALLIQLSTLTRIGEVTKAKWIDVDFERRTWVLPITKNQKQHKISLSEFSSSLLQRLRDITGATAWLLPNSKLDGCIDSKTITKQVADRQRENKPLTGRTQKVEALKLDQGDWRPHDLRRTGASCMAELGVLPDVIERCLNHTEQNRMKRIYQVATYEGPMRDAWQLWGKRLEILSNKPYNVTTLKRA